MQDDSSVSDEQLEDDIMDTLEEQPQDSVAQVKKPAMIKVRVTRHVNQLRAGDVLDVPDDHKSRAMIAKKLYRIVEDEDLER